MFQIWPNMINNIKKNSIPLMLLNARITKKSFYRWKKFLPTAKNIFEKFDISINIKSNIILVGFISFAALI